MFKKETTENIIKYIAEDSTVLGEIVFEKEHGLNILRIKGNFRDCPNLKKLDQGLAGNVQVSDKDIKIATNWVSSEELAILFNIIESYEPKFVTTKTELIDSIPAGRRLPSVKPLSNFSGGFYKEVKKEATPLEYSQEDIKSMFPRLSDSDFKKVSTFGGLEKMSTGHFESGRTTRAHYSHPDSRIFMDEDVCRTTITQPDSKVSQIELRHSPRREHPDETVSIEKNNWTIAFKSDSDAQAFLEIAYADESIIKAQERINKSDFSRHHFGDIVTRKDHIIRFKCEVPQLLDLLNKSGFCPKQAIQHQQEQVGQMLNTDSSVRFKI